MKIIALELPDDPALYLGPSQSELPDGWPSLPADRSGMSLGTKWLLDCKQLGLILPSAAVPVERNIMLNPRHPAISQVKIVEMFEFNYDERLFALRL